MCPSRTQRPGSHGVPRNRAVMACRVTPAVEPKLAVRRAGACCRRLASVSAQGLPDRLIAAKGRGAGPLPRRRVSFRQQSFLIPRNYFCLYSRFVLDGANRTNIITAVPYRYGARRGGRHGVERGAEVREACWPRMSSDRFFWRRTGRPRQGERTARVNVRATARTNGERGRKLLTLGHPAGR